MPVRSSHFGTLTMMVCCGLMPVGLDAHGAEPAGPAPSAATTELPGFQAGLWEYRRIVVTSDSPRPRFASLKKCADPSTEMRSTEMRKKMAQLKNRDCQFEPLVFRDGGYVSGWTCPTPNGPMQFRHVLIVKDPTGYLAMSEMRFGQRVTRQKLEARRLGECPGAGRDAPANPAGIALPPAQK